MTRALQSVSQRVAGYWNGAVCFSGSSLRLDLWCWFPMPSRLSLIHVFYSLQCHGPAGFFLHLEFLGLDEAVRVRHRARRLNADGVDLC